MVALNLVSPLKVSSCSSASSQIGFSCRCSSQAPSPSFQCRQSPPMTLQLSRNALSPGFSISSKQGGGTISASTSLPQSPRPLWPIKIPRPLVYSTNLADVDPVQLSELWAKTLQVSRDPRKIMKALHHSFMFVVVLAEQENADLGTMTSSKVVGIGRAVSDGAFIATICDVAVDPEYQNRGIGRRIVKRLVQEMKRKGGPTGFAVFPPPLARRFFWLIGFRSDRKYHLMAYIGKVQNQSTIASISAPQDPGSEDS